jgi:hypothetical protein
MEGMNIQKGRPNPPPVGSEKPAGRLYRLLLLSLLPGMIYFGFVAAVRFTPLLRWGDTPGTSPLVSFAALLSAAIMILVGFLVVLRTPGNVCGPLLVLFGIGSANTGLYETVQNGYVQAALQFSNQTFFLWALVALFVYFPDGVAYRPWAGRVTGWLALLLVVASAVGILAESSLERLGTVNPLHQEAFAPLLPAIELAGSALLFVSLVSSISAVILRYREVTGHQRRQMRWFMFCASSLLVLVLAWFGGFALSIPGDGLYFWLLSIVSDIALPLIPTIGIGVGILRHRLYDIDVIIRRTLIYGVLTVLLAGVYFGVVVLMQALLRPFTGAGNDLAVVATTLIIAGIVLPLRRQVQHFIDRRFYRRKYDAARTLAAFSDHMRDEVDLDKLTGRLVEVVDETMRPAHISLWVRDSARQPGQRVPGDMTS